MESIAYKLSWEIVALNDRGNAPDSQRLALEVAYGVSLKVDDPALFGAVMESIAAHVSDIAVQKLMRMYVKRVMK